MHKLGEVAWPINASFGQQGTQQIKQCTAHTHRCPVDDMGLCGISEYYRP